MFSKLGRSVLIVGAHADDIEIACGGTAHRLLSEGVEVTALVVTDTHYVRNDVVHRDSSLAQKEARAAANIIGYQTYFGTARNNDVKVTSELVYFIRDYIEKFKADAILTHWDGDAHLDHRNVAAATMMATRDPRNLLMFRTNFYMSPEAFRPNLLVDITDHFEIKMKALACYRAELDRNGDAYFDWVRHANRVSGATAGTGYAEEFRIVKYFL
jgi:N-acetylglucosamine malate deacetylase 1